MKIRLIVCCFLMGCSSPAPKLPAEKTYPVHIAQVIQKDVPVYTEVIGTISPYQEVEVKPQVGGKIKEVYVRGGHQVHKGNPLYLIDPIPYELELARAQANLSKDEAQLGYAREKLERYKRLVASNFVSRLSIEEYVSDVKAKEAQVAIDQAAVNIARVNLGYCLVTAPMDGWISVSLIDPGNVVIANDPTALLRIMQITPIFVYFSIAQGEFQQIQKELEKSDLSFKVVLPFGDHREFNGQVVAVDNRVNVDTGTIRLKGLLPNEDKTLWPGEFVRVKLYLKTKQGAIIIPASALQVGQQGSFVYVVQPDLTVKMVKIKIGEQIEGGIVVDEGLEPTMTVVTDGQLNLIPGAKVNILQSDGA